MSRIAATFARLKAENRAGFVPFISAGDPDMDTCFAILSKLPGVGADVIELGVPFTDPMADGPAVQAAGLRALKAGATLHKVLDLVRRFRKGDDKTPIVLMGYFNPVHAYGIVNFVRDASAAGVDGLIIVDLGPEEDAPLRQLASGAGIDIVRLATPTTDDTRLPTVLAGASGYLYYVSITGVTGTKDFSEADVRASVGRIKRQSPLPVAVGFGIKTPEHAAAIARFADAAVVGSAIVSRIAEGLAKGKTHGALAEDTISFCRTLAKAVREARG